MRGHRTAGLVLIWVVLWSGGVACGSSPTEAERLGLVGRWEWVRATGGIAGVERTPDSEGFTRQLRFFDDGSVELRRDRVLQVRTDYDIRSPSNDPGAPDDPRIFYGEAVLGVEWQYLSNSGDDTLVLTDPCCDLFVWEFRSGS